MTGILLLAALKTLSVLGVEGGYSEEIDPAESAIFARADKIVAAITADYKAAYGDEPTCALIEPSEGAHLV